MPAIFCLIRKNDPCEAIERIAKGEHTSLVQFLVLFIFIHCCRSFCHRVIDIVLINLAFYSSSYFHYLLIDVFSGLRSRIDVGVIVGGGGESHYFLNVADIHL